MDLFYISIISYFFGSVPFGYLLTKIFLKKDIRDIGSGNIGATNVLRTGNKIVGYSTLILDISKTIIPVLYVKFNHYDLVYLSSLCVFLGHLFPIWLKFKGGKGVASYIGILFSLNLVFGIIFIISWIIIFLITKYSSLSSLIGSLSIPIYLLVINQLEQIGFFMIMLILILYTHRENIKRLKNRQETKTKIY